MEVLTGSFIRQQPLSRLKTSFRKYFAAAVNVLVREKKKGMCGGSEFDSVTDVCNVKCEVKLGKDDTWIDSPIKLSINNIDAGGAYVRFTLEKKVAQDTGEFHK